MELLNTIHNKLPDNLEEQYQRYARSVIKGHTMTRKEWLMVTYPGFKGEWK